MLQLERHTDRATTPTDHLTLVYDERKKSRLRAVSHAGRDVAIVLPRGATLRDGDLLSDSNGLVFEVRAAPEPVSEARTPDPMLLTRAAYHLGNRHVPLQIEEGLLRYQPDHVLDAMVCDLGLQVTAALAPFEPEGGAYAHSGGHAHEFTHAKGPLLGAR